MNYVRMGNSGLKITEITFGSALTIGTECMDFFCQKFDSNGMGFGNTFV